jgi:hypothetical protein
VLYKPLLCYHKAGPDIVFYTLGYRAKCTTLVEPEAVSHIPNPLFAGDPIIDLVVCLTAGTAAEDTLREIKGEAFERTLLICICSTGHTLHIYDRYEE